MSEEASTQRIDRWLWFARVVKSRTLGASLVAGGKIRLNRERLAKPSGTVRVGDVVTATVHRQVRVLRVAGLGTRRGPPEDARTLFEDLAPPPMPAEQRVAKSGVAPGNSGERTPGSGRPTKRDRRDIDRLRPDVGDRGSGTERSG